MPERLPDLVVVADDRTGALEVAGMCADAGAGGVRVVVSSAVGDRTDAGPTDPVHVVVTDLGSRHLSPAEAALKSMAIDARHAMPAAASDAPALGHKIDSALRGNWHHELLARSRRTGRRVLVVPAFPALGRVCVHGVVLLDAVPVGDGPTWHDPLTPVRSSRPADFLLAAGADRVEELGNAADVQRWADMPTAARIAVCDARTDDDLHAIAVAWVPIAEDVLLAGTAATLAATIPAFGSWEPPITAPPLRAPVLVVCGSLHPTARRQLEVLGVQLPGVEIIASPEPTDRHAPIDGAAAARTAAELAQAAHRRLADRRYRTVVVLGGDTAAAMLGDRPVMVGGTIADGLPWLRSADTDGPLVLTRSGGFGNEQSLVDLLRAIPWGDTPT